VVFATRPKCRPFPCCVATLASAAVHCAGLVIMLTPTLSPTRAEAGLAAAAALADGFPTEYLEMQVRFFIATPHVTF
jgi:hypothetical protein